MSRRKPVNYINNREFTDEVSRWKVEWLAYMEETGTRMRVSEKMGECFMMLTKRYGSKANFAGYTYNEDMQSEGILCCVKYAHNFNPEKSTNAFAYFTRIIHNAFLQFLGKEKKFATFKFNQAKEASPALAKYDYNGNGQKEYSGAVKKGDK